ncbi:MAG: hypothetical protein RLZ47_318 [Bacteroidota bacterium]|jgi:sensor histidine kinase YesM
MKNYQAWLSRLKYHCIGWGSLIFYETVLVRLFFGIKEAPVSYLFHYIVTILLFYFYSEAGLVWVINKRGRLILKLILLIAFGIIIYLSLHFFVEYSLNYFKLLIQGPSYYNISSYFVKSLYRSIYFLGLATGYYYLKTYLTERKKSVELEKQHLKDIIHQQHIEQELVQAQNAFLKAQINPHFLFNTLDFVYHEVNASSPKAGETIISLSNMMRYALDAEQQGERVKLIDELKQVEELIRIYRLRNENLQLEFRYDAEVTSLRIIPLVLLTLVENMFKHGLLNQSDNPARIQVAIVDGQLEIITRNLVGRSSKSSHQQGLENIRKRLEHAYGKDAYLTYGVVNNTFELKLRIAVKRMY